MLGRQTSGSVVCPTCGKLVGVNDVKCWSCGRPHPGMWGFAPLFRRVGNDLGFVPLMIGACGLLYVLTLVVGGGPADAGGLALFEPSGRALFMFGASGTRPVLGYGRWWTVLSAGWLHGGLLHIAFNVLWIRQLAPAVAELYGAGRMVILYVVSGAVGFLFSSFGPVFLFPLAPILGSGNLAFGGTYTVGASAPIFGLLGAMVLYGRRGSSHIGRQAWIWAGILFVFGLLWPNVDNWAHLGGFLGGLGMAKILDPLKPERGDHLLVALLLLVATAAAIVASVVTGLPMVR